MRAEDTRPPDDGKPADRESNRDSAARRRPVSDERRSRSTRPYRKDDAQLDESRQERDAQGDRAADDDGHSNGRHDTRDHDARSGRRPDEHGEHGEAHDEIPTDLPDVPRKVLVLLAIGVVLLIVGLFALGWFPHKSRQEEAKKEGDALAGTEQSVNVITPRRDERGDELLLPGGVQALQATALFARTNGYLNAPMVDIGDHVKQGQLLAEIAAPEVDAELDQARATLQQAQVTVGRATNEYNFNKATYDRFAGLEKTGGVTKQQLDEKQAALNIATSSLKSAQANVAAAEAAVKRNAELQSFQKIVAPFDGKITARNYDQGALISASSSGAGQPLFRIEQTDTLRMFINVPQRYAMNVKVGLEAELLLRSNGGKPPVGKVVRTAGALDAATRTLRVEVHFANQDDTLLAGMYGQVRFRLKPSKPMLVVPTSVLAFGPEGMRVATVTDNHVKYHKVTVGRDYGTDAEIVEGLTGDEKVVVNPGEQLADGAAVKVLPTPPPADGGGKPAGKTPGQGSASTGGGHGSEGNPPNASARANAAESPGEKPASDKPDADKQPGEKSSADERAAAK